VLEDPAVRDVEEAAGALLGVHPLRADLEHHESERADVDDVARVAADLDAVADAERTAQQYEQPACEVRDEVLSAMARAGGEIEVRREPRDA
jgi:hypothetical protein